MPGLVVGSPLSFVGEAWVGAAEETTTIDVASEEDTAGEITPAVAVVTYNLYRSPSSGFTPGPSNLIAEDLGPFFVLEDAPLLEQTTYYYVAGAVTAGGEVFSLEIAVTTLPQLALITVASDGAEFGHAENDVAVEIQYQTTTDADPTFAAPVNDVIQTNSDRFRYLVTGLSAGNDYRTRARTRLGPSGAWEAWSNVIEWTATAVSFSASAIGQFTSPPFGYPVRDDAAFLWTAGGTVTAVHISDDFGATWSSLAGWTQTGIVFDTTPYTDGPHIVRVTQSGGCTYFYHGGFLIDNANEATYEDDFYTAPRPAVARYFSPNTTRYLPSGVFRGSTGHIGVANLSSFGPVEPPELTACRGVCFMGECVAAGTGAGFQWDRTQAGELLDVGLIVLGSGSFPGGEPIGVRVGIKHFFMTTALSPLQRPIPDPADPFRFVGVARASEHTRFEVGIGEVGVQPGAGWHRWSLASPAGMSWTKMTLGGTSQYTSRNRIRPYQFILFVTRPDPINFPTRLRVRARLDGPDAWHCTGRHQLLVDETVDVLDGAGDPYTFEPGHIAFFTNKTRGNRSEDSGRFLTRYSAVILEEPLPPPTPPEADTPTLVAGKPCTVVLRVYADDGVTLLWEVGTDPAHENPYLVEPGNYGEQEIDVASGGASIATASVVVTDPAQIVGDQDSGWLTEHLAFLGLPNIAGHRCELIRFISEGLGYQVIVDGPASPVRLSSDYASYTWEIRDTRETERKVRAFETTVRSLIPDEHLEGYGYDPLTGEYVIDPAQPLRGHWNFSGGAMTGTISTSLSEFPENGRRLLIWQSAYEAIYAGLPRLTFAIDPLTGVPIDNPNALGEFSIKWRAQGSSDAWNEIRETLHISLSTDPSKFTQGNRVVGQVQIHDRRLNNVAPINPDYDPLAPALPTEDQIIEFFLIGPVSVDEQHPFILETPNVSAGAGLLNVTAAPVLGRFDLTSSVGGFTSGLVDLLALPGNPVDARRLRVATYDAIEKEDSLENIFIPSAGTLRWRLAGSSDPYTEITLDPAEPGGSSVLVFLETPFNDDYRIFITLLITAPDAAMPADNADIEIVLLRAQGTLTASLTAGQFGVNVYDGLYSRRDRVNGSVVPTGIRYDQDAMLQMTDLVRLRITEPWDDARDELEKKIYAPTGWVPALDIIGRISPVSQVPPVNVGALPTLYNGIVEPSPDWDSGQRIINILRFTYPRDYANGKPDPSTEWDVTEAYKVSDIVLEGGVYYRCILAHSGQQPPNATYWNVCPMRQNVVDEQDVVMEFEDPVSVARHGPEVLELDGSLFRAIGREAVTNEEQLIAPSFSPLASFITKLATVEQRRQARAWTTSKPIVRSGLVVVPILSSIELETGWLLAQLRQVHIHNRFSLGAPSMRFHVMRSAEPTMRVGDWRVVDLTWFPDYVTGRRGLVTLVQVVSLGDLDCAWRRVVVEQVAPLDVES